MSRITLHCLCTLACLGSAPLAIAESLPPGFRSLILFDGWHGRPHIDPAIVSAMSDAERAQKMAEWMADAKNHWRFENGELVNDGSGAYLVTNRDDYRDFELMLEYRTVARADSGIYLKGTPQVQIWDYTDPAKFNIGSSRGSGGLWNNSPGAAGKDPFVLADRRFGEWNKLHIRQIGARTTVYLNDLLVVNHAIMENYWNRSAPLAVAGNIQLQTHGGEIRWRNLWIKELSTAEANGFLSGHEAQAFTPIFNGKDLAGWQGNTDDYEVVDGAIRCRAGRGGQLLTEREYANFVARLEFRLPPGGNNGLAIRAPDTGDPAYKAMTELQVLDSEDPKYANLDERQYHGSAYGMAAARRGYLRKTGDWNFQQVTVDGSRITVELNGTVILDTDLQTVNEYLADRDHPGKNRTSGFFGFAGHSDPVEFREISVKVLAD